MSSASGKDTKDSTASSTVTSTDSDSLQQSHRNARAKRNLRLPAMPPAGITTTTKPLIGTPYSCNHPPFEYPFHPSVSSAASSPLYIPTPEKASQSSFPYAPALLPRGIGNSFWNRGVESLGLGIPMWKRGVSPLHPRFQPSGARPPIPPGLIDKMKDKLQSTSGPEVGDNVRKQQEVEAGDHNSNMNDVDDHSPSADREDTISRPPSPNMP